MQNEEITSQHSKVGAFLTISTTGGLCGYFSPIGVKRQRYKNFGDLCREKEDTFSHAKEKANGTSLEAFKILETEKNIMQKKHDEIENKLNELKLNEKYFDWNKDFKSKAGNTIKEYESANKNLEIIFNKNVNNLKTYLKTNAEKMGLNQENINKLSDENLYSKSADIIKTNNEKYQNLFSEDLKALDEAIINFNQKREIFVSKAKELNIKTPKKEWTDEGKKISDKLLKELSKATEDCSFRASNAIRQIKIPNRAVNTILGIIISTICWFVIKSITNKRE